MKNLNFIFKLLSLFQYNSSYLQQNKWKNNIKLSVIFSSLFITSSVFANNPNISISPTLEIITTDTNSVSLVVNADEAPNSNTITISYTDNCNRIPGTVDIAKGSTSASIVVNTDDLNSDESCTVILDSAVGKGGQGDGVIVADTSTITISSSPDISIRPTEQFVRTDFNSTTLYIDLSEVGNVDDINVSYEHDCITGTTSGTVTIPQGSTSQSFDVNTTGLNSGASCTVTLTNPVGEGSQEVNTVISQDTSTITALIETADLNITKTAKFNATEVYSVRANSEFQYVINVTNLDDIHQATNVVVTDKLPFGLIFIDITHSSEWSCTESSGTVTCSPNDENMSKSASESITIDVKAPSFEGYINNNVTVRSDNDTDSTNNSASAEIKVIDTNNTWDICYQNSTESGRCTQAGALYVADSSNRECIASVDIVNLDKVALPTDIHIYKLYEPNISQGTCDSSSDGSITSCVRLTDINKPNYTNYSGGYEYNLSSIPDANVTLIDTNTYNTSSEEITNGIIYAEYIRDGLAYAGKVNSCRSYTNAQTASYVDIIDPIYYQDDPYTPVIQTKVSKKDTQQLHVVHVDPVTFSEKDYVAASYENARLQVLLYRSDSTCTDELPLAEPIEGSPAGEPVIAVISHQTSSALTNTFTMKAIANRDTRIKAKLADWDSILDGLESTQQCFQNSNDSANFEGLPQCLNALGTNSGLSQELIEKYPHILTQCLNQTGGTYSACDSSAYDADGSKGGIYPPEYDHAYGCLACILDSIGEPGSCSRDNFAIRPNYFDMNTTDEDFPNLFRSGEDYNMTVYAYDYGETNGTVGTLDYNQTGGAGGNIDLNQTRYYKDGTPENTSNILFGDLVWSAWDFDMTHGISNQNGIISPVSATEVAGIQYNDVGKINISVEDREWAAVDINNPDDLTTEDCEPDGAYICGDKNVTYIPHHFAFSELNITNHAGPTNTFTYIADNRGMPLTTPPTRSPMAARLQAKIIALTKDGDITQNFRADDASYPYNDTTLYYENPVDINISVLVPSTGTNSYLYPDANESNVTNSYIGFGRTGLDDNGTRNILWDESNFPLDFNFRREINQEANPFDVNGSYIKSIKIISNYVDPDDGDTADINGSRLGDWNNAAAITACASDDGCIQDNAENNATFYYGRTRASKYFYEDITTASANTPITATIYCKDNATVNCSDYRFSTVSDGIDEPDWYLSMNHNATRGDGNISIVIGSPLIEPLGANAIDQAVVVDTDINTYSNTPTSSDVGEIMIINSGVKNDVNITRGTSPIPPLTVPIELIQDGEITGAVYTNEWLIYNEFLPAPPSPFYKVRFIGESTWTGEGQTGHVIDINASYKKSNRVDW